MKQSIYGFLLFLFLILPPVASLLESIMAIHMHMQMPLLAISGLLMARFFQIKFPHFFEKWNGNGIPGMLLFIIIWKFWMIPRTMDEALTIQTVELFKFISLPFLAGIPLRDSWGKLGEAGSMFCTATLLYLLPSWDGCTLLHQFNSAIIIYLLNKKRLDGVMLRLPHVSLFILCKLFSSTSRRKNMNKKRKEIAMVAISPFG